MQGNLKKLFATLGAAAAALALATPANATVLNFVIPGAFNAAFVLDSSTTPDFVYDPDLPQLFAITNVSGIAATTSGLADITFIRNHAGGSGGGLLISDHDGNQEWLSMPVAPSFTRGPKLRRPSRQAPSRSAVSRRAAVPS